MRIGLKLAIIRAGKTQRQVASETNIPENRLSELVRDWADPREVERTALSRVLGVDATELFAPAATVEKHVRGVLDAMQSAIVHADALGSESLVNELSTLKLDAARLFGGYLEPQR